ncbi:MAG TPA: DNA repair exonuclease [Gemmatimonadaceae bacterium]
MRLVHLSDLHLGYRQFQRQTAAGINQREADVAAVFRSAIDKVIEIKPDLVLFAGDVFHNVRPSNPAILLAFTQFSRLAHALPDATIVMVAGNHDAPRSAETVCILRLFAPLGIHVVDAEARRLTFPERDLSVLAVPGRPAPRPALRPDPGFARNVLVMHAEMQGVIPLSPSDTERAALQVVPEDIGFGQWTYVAMGEYHVFRQLAPNAFYSGSIEYTSFNIWGELQEEKEVRIRGKGIVEFDLAKGRRTFHSLAPARALVDLPVVDAQGLTAADIDAAIQANVDRWPGGIDDRIVRQVVIDIPRHVYRELDHRAVREYKRRTLSFQLDTRRPELIRQSASGAAGRRASLTDTVRDWLWSRTIPPDVDREALVELGLKYLGDAESAEREVLAAPAEEV